MQYDLLNTISSPGELKKLTEKELAKLCMQLRSYIMECVSQNGGHLASNLGAVELTIALHRAFSAPADKIIFDVGHQCYTHKIVTGRREELKNLRHEGGTSGFTKIYESDYDAFGAGHSSTSVSAALGFACAARIQCTDSFAIAVIGDGSLTGGLAYEGLNNAGRSGEKIIVVINDNDISISGNVGGVARYLHKITLSGAYFSGKQLLKRVLNAIPLIGKPTFNLFARAKNSLKKFFFNGNFFEDLGFTYFGPVDGHDILEMEKIFERAKYLKKPCVVHVKTVKGCGYKPAEDAPSAYHGVSPFELDVGVCENKNGCFSEAFGEEIRLLANENDSICAITAAMVDGVGLSGYAKAHPTRFFDVGIAEEHAVTFAAGLSASGLLPVFACYSTFLQRAYDQILHDAAIQGLKMVLAVDRAGFVGEDGETHQGLFDVSILRTIPKLAIYSPFSYLQLRACLSAALSAPAITAIRYPRGAEPELGADEYFKSCTEDMIEIDTADADIILLTYGRLTKEALAARLKLRRTGLHVGVISLLKIYPIDFDALYQTLKNAKYLFFFEEGMESGGIGEYLSVLLLQFGYQGTYHLTAVDNQFVSHAAVAAQLVQCKLDANSMMRTVGSIIKGESEWEKNFA